MIGVNVALWHSINSCCGFAKDKQSACHWLKWLYVILDKKQKQFNREDLTTLLNLQNEGIRSLCC